MGFHFFPCEVFNLCFIRQSDLFVFEASRCFDLQCQDVDFFVAVIYKQLVCGDFSSTAVCQTSISMDTKQAALLSKLRNHRAITLLLCLGEVKLRIVLRFLRYLSCFEANRLVAFIAGELCENIRKAWLLVMTNDESFHVALGFLCFS